ncbi:hypothetical protein EPI10_010451 [Gossypium australe]|uniref:Uncharacterized protein n=1 Tax=Gossypium australe TaxID=47621 RepID=A0A5B6W4A6_9ROSI|nr:hypothetical protein EPI10_010451 [Gossypium australe]
MASPMPISTKILLRTITHESDVSSHLQAPFVLSRVFAKPRSGNTVFENLDDPIATKAVSVGSFEFHSGILPDLSNDPATVMCLI